MTDTEYFAGVDVGATTTFVEIADDEGEVLGSAAAETPREASGDDVADHVTGLVRTVCEDTVIEPSTIDAVGIGSIGPLDVGSGRIVEPVNLPNASQIDLVAPMMALTGSDRVHLLNDASAGAIGEHHAHPDAPADMVYLTVSTGIGAGVVVDGRLLSGRGGNVGEVGHLVVDPAGRRWCGCGHAGHWEAYASGNAIPGFARDIYAEDPVGTELSLDDTLTARDILEQPSDALAARVIDRINRLNAIGVAAITHAYAPELIVVGGAVANNNPDVVVEPLRDRLPDMVVVDPPTVRTSQLGDRSVVRGALVSAIHDGLEER